MKPDILHDDGEQISVYVDHRYMRRYAWLMIFLILLCVLAAGNPFILPPDPLEPVDWRTSFLVFGSIACLLTIRAFVLFARSITRSPTLIVNADGITVYRSRFMNRKGLLHWNEIAWVGSEIRTGPSAFHQSLIINLFQFVNASACKPRTETPSPSAPYPFTTTVLRIGEELLDIPVGELTYEIERYIKVHAPLGWHGELSDEQRNHVWIVEPPSDPTVA